MHDRYIKKINAQSLRNKKFKEYRIISLKGEFLRMKRVSRSSEIKDLEGKLRCNYYYKNYYKK